MAVATAGLLGYRLTDNFWFPYFSPSIGEFWRRWHISLGTWLKDYIYIPLGGSWCPWPKRIRNIYVTMVLCGLWHGAGWQYIAFGALHATYVAVNRGWKHAIAPDSVAGKLTRYTSLLLTTYCLFFGWTIFRSEGLRQTADQIRMFFFQSAGGEETVSSWWAVFFAACALVHWGCYKGVFRRIWTSLSDWQYALAYGAAWALVLPWPPTGYRPFIYFQF
jgi:alginate O-acetyltransferase complex protein AlgI